MKAKNPPVCRCLARLPSESQKELNREDRQNNLRKKIILKNAGKPCAGPGGQTTVPRRAVLFDDVYTTGSTMDACAEALKSGGAEKVYGICLFYD
jgi:predicted amidophosphoribosyltransferase